MDYVSNLELTALKKVADETLRRLPKDKAKRVHEADGLVRLFDYYLCVGAGDKMIFEGVSAIESGEFLAIRMGFDGDHENHRIAEGNLNNPRSEPFFCDTLTSVRGYHNEDKAFWRKTA